MSLSNQCANKPYQFASILLALFLLPHWAEASEPTAEQALKLTPVQRDVAYDRLPEAEWAKCTVQIEKVRGEIGWMVRDPKGVLLRVFVDTNSDKIVDQWRYFQGGKEIYRDIDSNFNGKVDAYRWFKPDGERWGLDPDENGTIDSWKQDPSKGTPIEQVAASEPTPTTAEPLEPTRSPKEEAYERLLGELEKLELAFSTTSQPEEQAKVTLQKADLLERLAELAATSDERSSWLQHSVDMLSAAIQSGTCPEASKRLETLVRGLRAGGQDKDLIAYTCFEQLSAGYIQILQAPNPDYEKIQTNWSANLEKYIGEYGDAPPVADAMLQLAITHEYSDEVDKAKHWYSRLAREFGTTCAGKKATGAITRLESPGKEIAISGSDLSGSEVQLEEHRGKVVLLHYWATWSDFCKRDIVVLKELAAKHGASEFQILSINVDHSREDVAGYVKENSISWPQIFEEGGLESRLARQLGIVNVPTMLLIDKQGKVANRDIQVADLGRELERLK